MDSVESARVLIRTLLAGGVKHVVYCPGSRNAPLAYTLAAFEAAGKVSVQVFTEERSAGFYALGRTKATGEPVAVVVTSGTAVAELLPAFVEAKHQFLPLVAISADRPFELHFARASQTGQQRDWLTTDEARLLDIPAGEEHFARRLQQMLGLARGNGGPSGPIHVNIAFRDPLIPPENWTLEEAAQKLCSNDATKNGHHFAQVQAVDWSELVQPIAETVVVAGDQADPNVLLAAAINQIPVLAEPTVTGAGFTWIPHAPWLIDRFLPQVRQVVVTGHPTLSRSMLALANSVHADRVVVLSPHYPWPTPFSLNCVVSNAPIRVQEQEPAGAGNWLRKWRQASFLAERVISSACTDSLNHLSLAREIWQTPEALWLGASNTIRSFEIGVNLARHVPVYSNRGLAGIDGTIASALGTASVGQEVRAVMGDHTFVYDLPSLLAHSPTKLETRNEFNSNLLEDITIHIQAIVICDQGGSIFQTLEHGQERVKALHNKYFAAPTNPEPAKIARACNWEATRVETLDELKKILSEPVVQRSLIQVDLPSPQPLFSQLKSQILASLKEI